MTTYQFWITGWHKSALLNNGEKRRNAIIRMNAAMIRRLDAANGGKYIPAREKESNEK